MDAYVINLIVNYRNIQLSYMTNTNNLKDNARN